MSSIPEPLQGFPGYDRATRASQPFLAWMGLACTVLAGEAMRHDRLRARTALMLALILLGAGYAHATRRFAGWSRRTPLYVGFALSVGVAALGTVAQYRLQKGHQGGSLSFQEASVLSTVVLGWAMALWLAAVSAGRMLTRTSDEPLWGRHIALIAGIVAFVVLVAAHRLVAPGYRLTYDEQVYLMQSRWLSAPGMGAMADSTLRPFLPQGFYFVRGDRLFTQYPFGWPMMLAGARALGVLPILGALMGASAVAGCAALGRRWFDPMIGASAALLLLTQQWFLEAGAGLMTHVGTVACVVWAAYLLFRAESAAVRPQLWLAIAAGVLIGLVFDIRPLTGIAMGTTLAIWHASRLQDGASRVRSLIGIALGGLGPALMLLAYNRATTGSPFTLGYEMSQGSLHQLGFGLRGYRNGPTMNFTPAVAVAELLQRMIAFMRDVDAPFLLVPILALTVARGGRPRWRRLLPFLILPLVHALYFGNRDRFNIDLLPFAAIGFASLIWNASNRSWRAPVLVGLLAMMNLTFSSQWSVGDLKRASAEESRITTEIEQAQRDRRLLVLVNPKDSRLPFLLHGGDSTAPVLVFNSRDAEDPVLLHRFPDRQAVRVLWDSAHLHAQLVRIPSRH